MNRTINHAFYIAAMLSCLLPAMLCAQQPSAGINGNNEGLGCSLGRLGDGIDIDIEALGQTSSRDFAPLWLSGNRHGLVSPYGDASYERASLSRPLAADSARQWRIGYGLDLALSQHAQAKLMLHQAYAEAEWMKAHATIGIKERHADLRYAPLTSGGLSVGQNAQPFPIAQVEIDYFSIPHTDHWWKWRGRMSYGFTTDGAWQDRWVDHSQTRRYTSNTLYHEKALYWKFGREEIFPLTYEIGIQMMAQFGGTTYNAYGRGLSAPTDLRHARNIHAFWQAFWPMGSSDVTDGVNPNAAGNTLGSYNMRLEWKTDRWSVGAYFERFFEDHSMLTLQYGIYDHLVGIDAKLPDNPFVSHVLVEHISTRDQSGAVYHDGTANIPDAIAGRDNYYNHHIYTGWQHWGMAIGNPLITSPIYNSDHQLTFKNNRIMAWHFGLDGDPKPWLHWRAMATVTQNWGIYHVPFDDKINEQHYLLEATCKPVSMPTWAATIGVGLSHGALIGNTTGVQLTVRKHFSL